MTAKQVFEYALIELSKVKAPSLLLEDFNYFFNKAISNYINRRYGIYDVNLQTTDDLRVLKATSILTPKVTTLYDRAGLTEATSDWTTSYLDEDGNQILNNLYGNINEVELPEDYLHLLNCICIYKVKKGFKCYNEGSYVQFPATRLESDKWALIINDYYNKPCYKRPYYFIHNVNTSVDSDTTSATDLSTNPVVYELKISSIKYTLSSTSGNSASISIDSDNNYTLIINGSEVTDVAPTFDSGSDVTSVQLLKNKVYTNLQLIDARSQIKKIIISTNDITGYTGMTRYKYTGSENTTTNTSKILGGTDIAGEFSTKDGEIVNPNFQRTINLKGFESEASTIEKPTGSRIANPSKVRMEIRYGKDDRTFELVKVFVDYIKAPLFIRLTPELMDLVEDTSQVMEFPDYVCQEIINELVMLVMENASDPRLKTNPAVNLSIAVPGQQLAAQAASSE